MNYQSGLVVSGTESRFPSLGDFSLRDNAEHSSRARGEATARRTRPTLKGTRLLPIDSTSPNERLDSDFAGATPVVGFQPNAGCHRTLR
jgi:hypothetical protein